MTTMPDVTHSAKDCTQCDERKPLTAFARRASAPDGLRYDCRQCQAKVSRGYLLRRRFGIDESEYDRMLAVQGGRCALCCGTEPGGRWPVFVVDHCHETGRVRGLLCHSCNFKIGALGDTPAALFRAYLYVSGRPPLPA